MYYQIKDTLAEVKKSEAKVGECPFVGIITRDEFDNEKDRFGMGIDVGLDYLPGSESHIEVNYDSLTGFLSVPEVRDLNKVRHSFSFAVNDRCMLIIDDDEYALGKVQYIAKTKKWKLPSLARFIYDFLESIIDGDLQALGKIEKEMDVMEDSILDGKTDSIIARLADMRSEMLDVQLHYEQLTDIAKELEENENEFFAEDDLRYFRMFGDRTSRLISVVASLRDHISQIRDMHRWKMDEKMNKNTAYLNIIATIFLPLTLITSWYGMNFVHMPELMYPWAYPAVLGVCLAIAVICIIVFKKKKWF